MGTTYGGNGQTTFALPDLRGRTPVHVGTSFSQGTFGDAASHTLTQAQMPAHTHTVPASSNAGDQTGPASNYWANGSQLAYASSGDVAMGTAATGAVGGGQAHNNMPPFLTISAAVAVVGTFPSPP
jgi:microcystin-dependent protein